MERKYESTENDILLPFATACCDFRQLGNSKGVWNQSNLPPMQKYISTTQRRNS